MGAYTVAGFIQVRDTWVVFESNKIFTVTIIHEQMRQNSIKAIGEEVHKYLALHLGLG